MEYEITKYTNARDEGFAQHLPLRVSVVFYFPCASGEHSGATVTGVPGGM